MHGALENLSPLRVEPGERVQIRQQVLREVDESLARDLEMLAADPGNRGSGQALGQRFLSYAGIPDDVRSRVPELAELWRRADLYADVLRTIEIDVPSEAATRGANLSGDLSRPRLQRVLSPGRGRVDGGARRHRGPARSRAVGPRPSA